MAADYTDRAPICDRAESTVHVSTPPGPDRRATPPIKRRLAANGGGFCHTRLTRVESGLPLRRCRTLMLGSGRLSGHRACDQERDEWRARPRDYSPSACAGTE